MHYKVSTKPYFVFFLSALQSQAQVREQVFESAEANEHSYSNSSYEIKKKDFSVFYGKIYLPNS